MCLGQIDGKENVLARVHSECFTGEVREPFSFMSLFSFLLSLSLSLSHTQYTLCLSRSVSLFPDLSLQVMGSERCDCGDQLDEALRLIVQNGSGVLLYLRQEGRGIGLAQKLRYNPTYQVNFNSDPPHYTDRTSCKTTAQTP